jgi:CRISPR-associated protein Csm1
LRKRIAEALEEIKYRKFDLLRQNPVLKLDEGIDNQNQCELCGKNRGEAREDGTTCDLCDMFVKIGRELTRKPYLVISENSGQFEIFGGLYINFVEEPKRFDNTVAVFDIVADDTFKGYAKWEIASYVHKNTESEISTLEDIAKMSVPEGMNENRREKGVEALMTLKGDVDNMGQFIRESETTTSFARYNFFSRMTDYFFSVYATRLMENRPLYTVFAGGDDLFVLGAWDDTIAYAKELRKAFMRFAQGSPLTLSVGMVMSKPHKPVRFIAARAEDALEAAKETDGKDAVNLFGETVKWEDYLDDLGLSEELEKHSDIPTALLYRFLEFTAMSKRVKYEGDIEATMWKSKFAYAVRRSEYTLSESLLNTLDEMIEHYPSETRMVLSEFIYKRRSV